MLLLAIACNAAAIAVGAIESNRAIVNKDRFLADEIYASGGSLSTNDNGFAVFIADGESPSLSLSPDGELIKSTDNSVRIVINNESNYDTLKLEYVFVDSNGASETGTVKTNIECDKNIAEYILPLGEIDRVTSVKIIFEGGSSGTITLVSIGALSYYYEGREFCGTMVKSEYDLATATASLSGTVSWETVSKNGGAKIAVYRLEQNESSINIAQADSYIASCDISLSFSLGFPLSMAIDYYSKFLVAVVTKDGEIIPVAPEFYLDSSEAATGVSLEGDFKGIETDMYAGAVEAGSTVAFVDIELGKLISSSESGYQYVFDGEEYYLNSQYIAKLDQEMSIYSDNGTAVYFRLLIKNNEGAKYSSINIYNKASLPQFVGYVEYLIDRYSNGREGSVKGIVLGRSLDKSGEYNYCGQNVPMRAYAERLAQTCAILSAAISRSRANIEIVLPFSDSSCTPYSLAGYYKEDGIYGRDLLARATLEYLVSYHVELDNISFMLEGSSAPIKETEFDQAGGSGSSERSVSRDEENALTQCREFGEMTASLSSSFEGLSGEFIYCWYATDGEIANNYIYNYNIAANFENVKLFVVSMLDLADQAQAFSQLKSIYKYADTSKNPDISREALSELGVKDWGEIISNFKDGNCVKTTLVQANLEKAVPGYVKGSYKMWNFASTNNTLGWSARYGCSRLSIYNLSGDIPHSLVASIYRNGGHNYGADYGAFGYYPDSPLKLDGICGLSIDLFVPETESEKIYEVMLTVECEGRIVEASGVVFGGNEAMLYADMESIDTVNAITLRVRDLNSSTDVDNEFSVYVKSISLHSEIYSDGELEEMALRGGLVYDEESDTESSDRNLIETLAVVLVSITAVIGAWIIYKVSKKN